jgi:hypothetical protein
MCKYWLEFNEKLILSLKIIYCQEYATAVLKEKGFPCTHYRVNALRICFPPTTTIIDAFPVNHICKKIKQKCM